MTLFKRRGAEPIAGPLRIEYVPGMAAEMLADLAPLLAEEGVDVTTIDVSDLATLQAAMGRQIHRLTPVGVERDEVAAVLRAVAEAIDGGETRLATVILDAVLPEVSDGATVPAVIGLGVGCLDDWLAGSEPDRQAPAGLADRVRLPGGRWVGEQAAKDLLALARKGRAFDDIGEVIIAQGGYHLLFGTAFAVTAALQAWSQLSGVPLADLARTHLR